MCHQHTVTNLLLLPEFTITGLKASIPSPGTCLLSAGLLVCQAPAAYRHLLVTSVSYIIYYGMHSVHAILASSKNRDLGTRVWAPGFGCCLRVAWVFSRVHLAYRMPRRRTNQTRMHHMGVCTALLFPATLCIQMHPFHRTPRQNNPPAMCHWDLLLSHGTEECA